MLKSQSLKNLTKLYVIFMVLIFSGNAFSKPKPYIEIWTAVSKNNELDGFLYEASSLLGLKKRKRLKSKNIFTYKFEVGVNKKNSNNFNQQLNYLFVGLKGKNGEFRLGRHDLPYSIVDNSMDKFFIKQSNGLISKKNPSDLLGYINRIGDFGVFVALSPFSSLNDNSAVVTSLMLNYAVNNIYGGVSLHYDYQKSQIGTKIVFTYKSKHKANKYGVGVIFEKCPINSNATSETITQGQCSLDGGDSIYNISSNYQFGKQYFSAQLAKNNKTNIQKQTAEYGKNFGKHTKVYIELDKIGSVRQTSIGLVTVFK